MRNRYVLILTFLISLIVLGGCSANNQPSASKATGLEVEISSNPKNAKLLEPVKITAVVTNNGVPVSKDAEVEFELMKKDGGSIGSVQPENMGDGKYQIETIFDEEVVYQVVSHVTYENQHEMPIYEINVTP